MHTGDDAVTITTPSASRSQADPREDRRARGKGGVTMTTKKDQRGFGASGMPSQLPRRTDRRNDKHHQLHHLPLPPLLPTQASGLPHCGDRPANIPHASAVRAASVATTAGRCFLGGVGVHRRLEKAASLRGVPQIVRRSVPPLQGRLWRGRA